MLGTRRQTRTQSQVREAPRRRIHTTQQRYIPQRYGNATATISLFSSLTVALVPCGANLRHICTSPTTPKKRQKKTNPQQDHANTELSYVKKAVMTTRKNQSYHKGKNTPREHTKRPPQSTLSPLPTWCRTQRGPRAGWKGKSFSARTPGIPTRRGGPSLPRPPVRTPDHPPRT